MPLISLFLSCFMLMLGYGLIGTLFPVRMGIEHFSTDTIGLVLSMYAVGMLLGGNYSRRLILRVGHIRIFAASAALSSMSILLSSLFVSDWAWGLSRMVMGFCIACAFAAIDGWLSDEADESSRGRILATSQIVVMAGLFGGQFLLNLDSVVQPTLFIVGGVLLTGALLPLVMSKRSGPVVHEMSGMNFRALVTASPLGVVSCFFSGLLYSAAINMLPVFAKDFNISGFDLSLFMASAIFGAFILQLPVGLLSDRFDRRKVLLGLLGVSSIATLLVPLSAHNDYLSITMFFNAIAVGVFTCLYPMSIAETFDRISRSEMASAMGGLLSVYALGSIFGPLVSSTFMKSFGNDQLFSFLAVSELLLLAFVIYRMIARAPLANEQQESFVFQQPSVVSALVDLDPRTNHELNETHSLEAQVAITIAENSPSAAVKMAIELAQTSPDKAGPICAALAQVDNIDVARLYKAITKAAPDLSLEIAEALVADDAPEESTEWVNWLASNKPEKVAGIVAELAEQYPAPSYEIEEEIRPADAEAYQATATELVTHFAENQPEQAIEIAAAVVETLPEVASEMVDILHESDQLEDQISTPISDSPLAEENQDSK